MPAATPYASPFREALVHVLEVGFWYRVRARELVVASDFGVAREGDIAVDPVEALAVVLVVVVGVEIRRRRDDEVHALRANHGDGARVGLFDGALCAGSREQFGKAE